FSSTGNTLGTLTINRSNNFVSQANVALNSALTINNTLFLTDGAFYAPSGLSMASGATIVRTPAAEFYTGSTTPGGGPYNIIYNDGSSNTLATGVETQGSVQNVTVNLSGTATDGTSLTVQG